MFVYVQSGLTGTFPAPTTPFVFDQQACRYHPHVFGVQVGQPIEIVNSDATLHNIHAMPKTNAEFNTAQPIKGMKTSHTFTAKEADVVVPFKCDVHGWMNAYAGVLDHPYFAVSKPDGSFSIPNLPPGSYTLGGVAREAGHADAAGHGCGEGIESGRELHVQSRRGSELVTRGSAFRSSPHSGSRGRCGQSLNGNLSPEPEPGTGISEPWNVPPCGSTVTRNSSQPPQSS